MASGSWTCQSTMVGTHLTETGDDVTDSAPALLRLILPAVLSESWPSYRICQSLQGQAF